MTLKNFFRPNKSIVSVMITLLIIFFVYSLYIMSKMFDKTGTGVEMIPSIIFLIGILYIALSIIYLVIALIVRLVSKK